MSRILRQLVRDRGDARCEYCHLPDFAASASSFHVEHVFAKQHGGSDDPSNRCWCCQGCNLHKGPNLSGRDPVSGNVVRLFDPRRQSRKRHFEWSGPILLGRTQTGRATIAVLAINEQQRVDLRQMLRNNGEWPDD